MIVFLGSLLYLGSIYFVYKSCNEKNHSYRWIDLAVLLPIIGAIIYLFKKSADDYNQKLSSDQTEYRYPNEIKQTYIPKLVKSFHVIGKNQATNRRKGMTVHAKTQELAELKANEAGILPPYEVELLLGELPTEPQLNYARNLGITIPTDATKEDVSYLISRQLDRDLSDPNPGLLEFADNRDMISSKYLGKKQLYDLVFNQLSGKDKIAFFVFSIYRWLSDDRRANLDTHPEKDTFYRFAETVIKDDSFLKSMNRYSGKDLRIFGKLVVGNFEHTGASTNTIAYKKGSQFLSEEFETPLTRTKVL